ncbi:hypothetical protein QF037_008899 [Streptomyces canus]|nr:hypothetical protein [Streptomyces canus]
MEATSIDYCSMDVGLVVIGHSALGQQKNPASRMRTVGSAGAPVRPVGEGVGRLPVREEERGRARPRGAGEDAGTQAAGAGLPRAEVGITVTTTDDKVSRWLGVRAPLASRRLRTLAELTEAGIPAYAFVGPLLPHFATQPELPDDLFGRLVDAVVFPVKSSSSAIEEGAGIPRSRPGGPRRLRRPPVRRRHCRTHWTGRLINKPGHICAVQGGPVFSAITTGTLRVCGDPRCCFPSWESLVWYAHFGGDS